MISAIPTIEEGAVALLHLHHVQLGGMVADAGPFGALGTGLLLLVPRPGIGLRFDQPVLHRVF
jgi:hypothetical protein